MCSAARNAARSLSSRHTGSHADAFPRSLRWRSAKCSGQTRASLALGHVVGPPPLAAKPDTQANAGGDATEDRRQQLRVKYNHRSADTQDYIGGDSLCEMAGGQSCTLSLGNSA